MLYEYALLNKYDQAIEGLKSEKRASNGGAISDPRLAQAFLPSSKTLEQMERQKARGHSHHHSTPKNRINWHNFQSEGHKKVVSQHVAASVADSPALEKLSSTQPNETFDKPISHLSLLQKEKPSDEQFY